MEENPTAGLEKEESEGELEYDEDGNPIAPVKSKVIFAYSLFSKSWWGFIYINLHNETSK